MEYNSSYLEDLNITAILQLWNTLTDKDKQQVFQILGVKDENELFMFNSEQSPNEIIADIPAYKARNTILEYVPIILILIGTFGNVFSFIILRSRAIRRQSTYIYLSALAVADTAVLYFGLLPLWLSILLGYDVKAQATWLCKVMTVAAFVCSHISVWLIVAVTIERFIVVCHPLKASNICNMRKARIAIFLLCVIFFAINSHFFWTVDAVTDVHGVDVCKEANPDFKTLVIEFWPWVDAMIYSFLPFAIITVLNGLIVKRVVSAHKKREQISGSVKKAGTVRESAGRKLTIMLLTVSCAFLVTTLPMNVTMISAAVWNKSKNDYEQMAKFQLGRTITELVMYVNHSMNFFLYCASGQKFRHHVMRLVKTICHKTGRTPYRRSFSDQSSIRIQANTCKTNADMELETNCNCQNLPNANDEYHEVGTEHHLLN